MALQADVTNSAGQILVDTTAGLPAVPFTLAIDYGQANEELVTVTGIVGTNLSVSRGQDGTAAASHTAGAVVRHVTSARDFREPQDHLGRNNGVHGVFGNVVGTSDSQSLDLKTFVSANGHTTPLTVKAAASQDEPLLEIQNSAGSAIGSVDQVGRTTVPGLYVTKPTNSFASIVARMGSGQTLPLLDLQGTSGSTVFNVSITGAVTASGAVTAPSVASGKVNVIAAATGVVPLTVKRIASQTAHLQDWTSETDTVLAYVDKDGNGRFNNLPARLVISTVVVSCDSSGIAEVPTGLTNVTAAVAWNGDDVNAPSVIVNHYGPAYTSGGSIAIRARISHTGAAHVGNLRVGFIATGT